MGGGGGGGHVGDDGGEVLAGDAQQELCLVVRFVEAGEHGASVVGLEVSHQNVAARKLKNNNHSLSSIIIKLTFFERRNKVSFYFTLLVFVSLGPVRRTK